MNMSYFSYRKFTGYQPGQNLTWSDRSTTLSSMAHSTAALPFQIPFSRPVLTGQEMDYLQESLQSGHLSGDGPFTKKCHQWLEWKSRAKRALLTTSGTSALEMSMLLANIKTGDEVIMPSFTFVSTANVVVLRGATPVFVDIRPDTLNLDESLIEAAITAKTKAILPVHYAGVACEMDRICEVARDHRLYVIEDAAHGVLASYKGKPLGSIGEMGMLSFHETKNLTAGECGALLLRDDEFLARAEIIREKGTNRSSFYRGEVNKYEWMDVGSSFLPSDLIAAMLLAQMEGSDALQANRMQTWNVYYKGLKDLEAKGKIVRPQIPEGCVHNAHIFYFLLPTIEKRDLVLKKLKQIGIQTTFHYVPLHSAPAGIKYGRTASTMMHTDSLHGRLLRLPVWVPPAVAAQILDPLIEIIESLE